MENDGHGEIIWKNNDFIFKSNIRFFFFYSYPFYRIKGLEEERREIVKCSSWNVTAITIGGYR